MMSLSLFFLFLLPAMGGLFLFFLGRYDNLKKNLSLFIFLLSLCFSIYLFLKPQNPWSRYLFNGYTLTLGLNKLSCLVLLFANLLGALICLFSKDYTRGERGYFSWILWFLAFSNLQILATDFAFFAFSWIGSICILYALLNLGSRASARKGAVILGFSCLCFIIGAYIYSRFSGSAGMSGGMSIVLNKPICWLAFSLMLIGALAKTGSWPFHTWIPTAAESVPVTVMAIMPASLDKLIGVYLLSRLCLDFFVLNNFVIAILLIVGGLTIIVAAIMALTQHDLRKMLSYYTVSQAGYMVLGLGSANPVGIIGAIFHMFNNAIYSNGLFLTGGAAENKKGSFDMGKLGDLARYMPLTFVSGLILALSISGVPPFNGFASKWMIYQGAFLGLTSSSGFLLRFVYTFALIAAMFGSTFTLASFLKFIHAVFLGQDNRPEKKPSGETPRNMVIALLILSGLCVLLGVFSNCFIKNFLAPSFSFALVYRGAWNSIFVALFFAIAWILGFILWRLITTGKKVREDNFFVGGESVYGRPVFPATEFYKTIEEMPLFCAVSRFLKSEKFDIYNLLNAILRGLYFIFALKWLFKCKK